MSKRVLVVEDNELNLKLFCDLLKAHDYATEPVRDGREAVERARAFAPDLIVMDIQLPYVSGLELIETCKADDELRAIPIMAVTAYAGKEDEERVRAAGAEAYVSKPISLMRFIGEVIALTPKEEAAPQAEAAEDALPEDEVQPRAGELAFAEDLFPEDVAQTLDADVAEAEDPLPEDQAKDDAGSNLADDEASALDELPATPASEPRSRYSSTAGEPAEHSERQRDPGSGAGVTKEEGLGGTGEEPSSDEARPADEAGDEKPI